MVQRLAYLAFTEEAGVRLPVTEFFLYSFSFLATSHRDNLLHEVTKTMLYAI